MTNPVAIREVSVHFRARLLCKASEPHTENVPCAKHVDDARQQLAIVPDVARARQP